MKSWWDEGVTDPRPGPPFMRSKTCAGLSSCLNRRRNFTPWLSPDLELTNTSSGEQPCGRTASHASSLPKNHHVIFMTQHWHNSDMTYHTVFAPKNPNSIIFDLDIPKNWHVIFVSFLCHEHDTSLTSKSTTQWHLILKIQKLTCHFYVMKMTPFWHQ